MTREEIEELKGLAASMGLYDDKKPCKRAVILGKAIEALEQESCEDAIDRAKLLQRSVISVPFHMNDGSVDYADIVFAADICRAEPVQPKQKTGWWVDKDVRGEKLPYCSVCGNGLDVVYHYAYCPNCGAKMEVEE